MGGTSIRVLKNSHAGATIHVVGSGASMSDLSPQFFVGRVVIAVNEMFRHVPCTFALMHHYNNAQEATRFGKLVVSNRDYDMPPNWGRSPAFTGEYYVYAGRGRYTLSFTPMIEVGLLEDDTTDSLVMSACTTSEALQFAAHLGAATILVSGVDGGAFDGRWNVRGYNVDTATKLAACTNPQHIRLTHGIVLQTIAAIRRKGIGVYALGPYIGGDHEGHEFTKAPVLHGDALVTALTTVNREAVA